MPPEASNALPDPTDPSGTLRPDEPPAKNSVEPPYRPLKISQRVGAPRLPSDLKSGDIKGLIDLFLPQGLFEVICEATNQYDELGTTKRFARWSIITPGELRAWLAVHIYMTVSPGVK